jgi:hypothetical protein
MKKRIPHMIDDNGKEFKYCKICNQFISIGEFNFKNASWDGLETCCKGCKQKKSYQFRVKNPGYDKEYQEENKEKLKTYKKEYYIKKKQIT